MRRPTAKTENFTRLVSEEEKAERGFDSASFLKRMQARIDKVRGKTDADGDSFFLRHNPQAAFRGLA